MNRTDDKKPESVHVLYVNSDTDFAELARTKLLTVAPDMGVTTVATADAALERLDTAAVDCVVTSYSLPDGTGVGLLERIEAERDDLPTILFTGRGSEQIASEATQADVSDYIPIRTDQNNFELLARRIQTLVAAARKEAVAERMSTRFQRTLERATDAIYSVDSEWRIEYMNQTMADRVDRDPEAVVGATLWEEFPSVVGTELEDRYRTAMETGEAVAFEQRLGDPFDYWVEVRAFPEEDGLTVFSRETTAEQERQLELERREFLFERVQDIADIGVWEYYPSTGDLEWSDGVRRIHGVEEGYEPSLDEAVDFYHPDDRETIEAAVEHAIEEGEPYDLDLRIVREDGDVCDVRAWGERVDSAGHPDSVLRGVLQDITERKDREREFRATAEEYGALLETSGDAIFLLDVDTAGADPHFEFARLSPGYETQTGLTTAEVRGETPRAVFGDDRGAELEANYAHCVEQRAPVSYREELAVDDDARFWDTSLAPVVVDGDISRILGIARNVTEQVERERNLETTNQRLESLIDATPLTVMEIDSAGTVTRWNDEAESMFGWSRAEVLDEFNPIVPADRQGEFATHRQRALSGERIRAKEIRRETKDGDELDLLLSVAPITEPSGEVSSIIAVLEDITPQKRLEEKLRSLQETARRLSGAASSEEVGHIAVEAVVDVLGFDLTGIWEYAEQTDALVPLETTPATRELVEELPRIDPGEGLAWTAFEGSEVCVYDDLQTDTELDEHSAELDSGLFVPLGEQGLIGVGTSSSQAFSDTDVELLQILGATVEAALVRASREAELGRQNERLDEFASVVAHDLRNPLSVAIGFLEIVEETGDLEHLDRVAAAHERMERLIDDLLTLARGETSIANPEQIDLETVTTQAWGYVDTADARLALADSVPTVAGDGSRLTQLFENLFRNALEHGGRGVTVTVGPLGDDDGFYVEDDGEGIAPDRRDEVLDYGVTSNEDGTGFGLSIVADIAAAHGWTVSVTASSDGGARFEFAEGE